MVGHVLRWVAVNDDGNVRHVSSVSSLSSVKVIIQRGLPSSPLWDLKKALIIKMEERKSGRNGNLNYTKSSNGLSPLQVAITNKHVNSIGKTATTRVYSESILS